HAEDGIRDRNVTGVQTCALPIWAARRLGEHPSTALDAPLGEVELPADFTAAMDDDLTVPEALAVIHREQSALNTLLAGRDAADPAEIADSLGRLDRTTVA